MGILSADRMKFTLIDAVIEQTDERIVAVKRVSAAEEYLADHFPTFPVLPGVLMLEAMAQAGRTLLARRDPANARLVLGEVRSFKYGSFVRPGESLRVDVSLHREDESGAFDLKATSHVLRCDGSEVQAASGRFVLRPMR